MLGLAQPLGNLQVAEYFASFDWKLIAEFRFEELHRVHKSQVAMQDPQHNVEVRTLTCGSGNKRSLRLDFEIPLVLIRRLESLARFLAYAWLQRRRFHLKSSSRRVEGRLKITRRCRGQ